MTTQRILAEIERLRDRFRGHANIQPSIAIQLELTHLHDFVLTLPPYTFRHGLEYTKGWYSALSVSAKTSQHGGEA